MSQSVNGCPIVSVSDTVNFLGISIVGQSNKAGDGGIYVGSIMKGYVTECATRHKIYMENAVVEQNKQRIKNCHY